jgi:O-antigen/teichoic acid export membrane protein
VLGILMLGPLFGLTSDIKLLALLFSLSLLTGVTGTPKGYFRLRGDYKSIAIYQVSLAVALLFVAIALYVLKAPLVLYCVALPAVSATFNCLMFVWLIVDLSSRNVSLLNPFGSLLGRRVLRIVFSRALSNGVLSSLVNSKSQLPLMIVAGMNGPSGAGIFAVASRGASLIARLTATVNHVIFPNVVEQVVRRRGGGWARQVWIIAAVTMTVSAMTAVLGYAFRDSIISILAGRHFASAATVFVMLLLSECFIFASLQFSAAIQSIDGTVRLTLLSAVTTIVALVVGLWLGSFLGVLGVAAGLLVASAFSYVATLIWCLVYSLRSRRGPSTQNGGV